MAWLFVSGHAVDIVLIVIVIESAYLKWRGSEWRTADILMRLMPAVLILLALRAALTEMDWWWIALPLALSFPFHLADITRGPSRR